MADGTKVSELIEDSEDAGPLPFLDDDGSPIVDKKEVVVEEKPKKKTTRKRRTTKKAETETVDADA
jgi:hypothetical protein